MTMILKLILGLLLGAALVAMAGCGGGESGRERPHGLTPGAVERAY